MDYIIKRILFNKMLILNSEINIYERIFAGYDEHAHKSSYKYTTLVIKYCFRHMILQVGEDIPRCLSQKDTQARSH